MRMSGSRISRESCTCSVYDAMVLPIDSRSCVCGYLGHFWAAFASKIFRSQGRNWQKRNKTFTVA